MATTALRLAVAATSPECQCRARELAGQLAVALLDPGTTPALCTGADALLLVSPTGLALQQTGRDAPGPVVVDFGAGGMRHRRRGGQNELLGRAVGAGKVNRLRVLDATAGLGRDSFVLADLGCEVTLCERHPVIASLLASGIDAAVAAEDPWLRRVAGRLALRRGDVRALPGAAVEDMEVIYLDPMFPARGKRAAVKKEMRLFQALLGDSPEGDAAALLDWALQQNVARVVVKRPLRAGALGGREPSHSLKGRSVRFDIHVRRALHAG